MKDFLLLAKALSDPTRVRALMALRQSELCLCQLIDLLGLAPSTISKHMSLLQSAGLVEQRKEGRWRFFRIPASPEGTAKEALAWTARSLQGDPQIQDDARRVRKIMKMDKDALCRHYNR